MSNNFPAVPTDLLLTGVTYTFTPMSEPVLPPITGTSLMLVDGLAMTGGTSAVEVTFTTPGQAGDFDQTTFEELVSEAVTNICQLWATLEGTTLADEQAKITSISRQWTFADAAGNTAVYTDSMPYPPAS